MKERIESALKVFRYKRTNIKAVSWGMAIMILVGGILLLNYLYDNTQWALIQNPWVSFALYIIILILAAAVFTYYNDFKLRKALSELDFIVDELKDPKHYLEIIDDFGKFNKRLVTPAYLHGKLRAMMYYSSNREIQEFVHKFKDELGDSLNVETALFRIKSYGEKRQSVDEYEMIINKKLDRAISRARSNAIRASLEHQRKWFEIQTKVVRLQYQDVLNIIFLLEQEVLTPLEVVRIQYYKGLAYAHLGDRKQAKVLFENVIFEGNTTRFVEDAKSELEKVRQ